MHGKHIKANMVTYSTWAAVSQIKSSKRKEEKKSRTKNRMFRNSNINRTLRKTKIM